MLRICISGLGKAGREIARVLLDQEDLKLVAAICSPGSDKRGRDIGEIIDGGPAGILVEGSDILEEVIFRTKPDVVLDFSNAAACIRNALIFSKMKVNMVVATTGFSKMELKRLFIMTRKYRNGIVYAPNITLGVNVLMLVANLAANIMNGYDFEILEIHHRYKKDSPSGTALKIAQEVEKGLAAAGGLPGRKTVPIHAVRAGGVVGRHEVMIIGDDDKIEISHESFSRKVFALGAIRAARFVADKSGYFEMSDVLDLKRVLGDYMEKDSGSISRKYRLKAPPAGVSGELWA